MSGGRVLAWVAGAGLAAGALEGADASPVIVRTAPGRFEIAAVDSAAAHYVAAAAEEGWRLLQGPLGLPPAYTSPVFVRLIPQGTGAEGEPFRVIVEPGGVVSVWLRGGAVPGDTLRRALVRGLLSRLGVAQAGGAAAPTVPRWLEHGCAKWWHTRAEAAQLDAAKQQAARMPPPGLAALLEWPRDGPEQPGLTVAALWLLTFLQGESGRAGEWPAFVRRLLAGGDAQAALAACYSGRFGGPESRELWWQTGWHQVRRVRVLPVLEAAESREQVGALARFVFRAAEGDDDAVVPLRTVLVRRGEPIVAAELARRAAELARLIPLLHPFYRNAGLTLAAAVAPGAKSAKRCEELCAAFEQDWRDGVDLEQASTAALEAWERRAKKAPAGSAGAEQPDFTTQNAPRRNAELGITRSVMTTMSTLPSADDALRRPVVVRSKLDLRTPSLAV
ncbi:MAG: hypothetical protein FJ399_15625, partial [Verrucomicrobia bacterium]|nr:hypothetical protein [Verrucomicrobiota bacterium]